MLVQSAEPSQSITLLEATASPPSILSRDTSPNSSLSRKKDKLAKNVRVFKHNHHTYLTCFGAIHVKAATCFAAFNVLIGTCCILFYCVFTSQEQRRPSLKLCAIPLAGVIVCMLFLFVGIIQEKAKLLYPFITFQVCF
ncbi:hypothetical protein OESDEN_22689 [Oesophagostomum dentatum]|uniref:DUF7027 domain-containing protein n=1 Tax=Oesophagostomum dentatum TaxID=61180 RepID=A0A0B1S1E3_OESDE|nr:hypothetical protein OESDEN_22689 [Oesophagostomum dentatum]